MEVSEATPSCSNLLIPCSLKRKRPPTIEIPTVLQVVKTPPLLAPASNDAVCFEGFGFGVSAFKGKKKFMEDTHKVLPLLDGNPTKGLVSGACCVTALIEGREVVVSSVGDCRAVLSRGGLAEALTVDHRAECEHERKRIETKGGYAEIHRGAWRVHGVLSVSRSIGDSHLKDWIGNQEAVDIVQLCMPEKKCEPAINGQSDGSVNYSGTMPSVLVPRISVVRKKNKLRQKPNSNKTNSGWINKEEDCLSETQISTEFKKNPTRKRSKCKLRVCYGRER